MTSPWDLFPAPPPLHTASRDEYKNCTMADWAGQKKDVCSVTWWAEPGKALAWAVLQDGPGHVECVLLYLFVPVLPPPLPLSANLYLALLGHLAMLPKLSSSF